MLNLYPTVVGALACSVELGPAHTIMNALPNALNSAIQSTNGTPKREHCLLAKPNHVQISQK